MVNADGLVKIENWKANGQLATRKEFEQLSQNVKKFKFPDNRIESYFTLMERHLTAKSNPLLAVKEFYNMKQNSMTSAEFLSKVSKTGRQCNFPNKEPKERDLRNVIYRKLNSQRVREKCMKHYIYVMHRQDRLLLSQLRLTSLQLGWNEEL